MNSESKEKANKKTSSIRGYKDLQVWQKGIEIVDATYEATKNFPQEEKFGLCSQMQRAAVSIPSNIAEGVSRQHTKEYHRFCCMALASCAVLETQVIIAKRRNYLPENLFLQLEEMLDHESRMLMNLIKTLK